MKTTNKELTDAEFDALMGEPEAPAKTGTLSLDTVDKPDDSIGVEIDGVFYEYANPQEWSLFQRNEWHSLYGKLQKLEKVTEPNETHEQLYNEYSIKLLRKCSPDLPTEKLEYLNMTKRTVLLMDFLVKSGARGGVLSNLSTLIGQRQ